MIYAVNRVSLNGKHVCESVFSIIFIYAKMGARTPASKPDAFAKCVSVSWCNPNVIQI